MKPSLLHRPIVMVIVLLLAMLACLPGTSLPAQPVAPADTVAPPAVSATEAPAQPTQPSGEQYFTEDFSADNGNWSKVVTTNGDSAEADTAAGKVSLGDGRMLFDLGKNLIAYSLYQPQEYTDVRLDAHVENRGINKNDVLLICRYSNEGHYLVDVANSGLFSMYAYEPSRDAYTRIADGGSKKIKPGKDTNDYGLVCKGRNLTLYINGSLVRTYTDNAFVFRSGKVGIGVASEDLLPVTVEFDSLKISQP